jgi:hypothetical protein
MGPLTYVYRFAIKPTLAMPDEK